MSTLALVGDNIENPWNALTMLHAADMLESVCWFRDNGQLAKEWAAAARDGVPLPLVSLTQLKERCPLIVAFDNTSGAAPVYGFRLPKEPAAALVVGNERRGLARDLRAAARYALQIPMVSHEINCLNVAAAAAVGLYYLAQGGGQKLQATNHPDKRRPELLLVGAGDHVELGSSIRSACAFGWERALVEDRFGVWFGCDRITRSEGRGAARRGRNSIRLLPVSQSAHYDYRTVAVITTRQAGTALMHSQLSGGPSQLVVIPDESRINVEAEDWQRLGNSVQFINPGLPAKDFVYHYRLLASIAMAEAARQTGQKPRAIGRERFGPRIAYEKALQTTIYERGELEYLEDLRAY